MVGNYFKIAIRTLVRFKGYASINIIGLAIGVASCLLIVQYVLNELNFDKHHPHKENIYRVSTEFIFGERQQTSGTTPSPFAFAIVEDFPEVMQSARLLKAPSVEKYLLKYENSSFFEQKGYYADSTFFRLLKYDFVAGDKDHALDEPYTVVLSASIAKKLFSVENPIGKTIKIESLWGDEEFKVTGVINPDTYPSHIDGSFYLSMRSGRIGQRFYQTNYWAGNNLFYTYIQLQPGTDPSSLEAKMVPWLDRYASEQLKEMGFQKRHFLEPLEDIYLYSEAGIPIGPGGNISFIYILLFIALFILLIACINFMNLATAKATVRAQEVGVRKVIGANRKMLIQQFMSEIFVYSAIAVVIAYVVAELALPLFNQMIGKQLDISLLGTNGVLLWIIVFALLTTLIAGSYPAIYLSSFSPVQILKGSIGGQFSARQVRKGLVVIQFVISIVLIQGVLVIYKQLEYVQKKDLGFSAEAKLVIPLNTPEAAENYLPLKQAFLQDARVSQVGGTSVYPGKSSTDDMIFFGEGKTSEENAHAFMVHTEPDYLQMMDFELLEGRFFSNDRLADTLQSAVVNEQLIKGLGYEMEAAVGKKMFFDWNGERTEYTIVGIIKDFHGTSLHTKIDGYAFLWRSQNWRNYLVASVETSDLSTLLASLEDRWKTINGGEPFEYAFMDEQLEQNYKGDQQVASIIFGFSLLAILISCLGLLGLSSFTIERRTKEIGIRKVLGATISNIALLISKDFIQLVLVALVIASPIAWYTMNHWLENFHYRIAFPIIAFVLAGMLAIGIAIGTISFQLIRAALSNPVESLRNE